MARYDAAIKDLDDALKLDPAIPSALFVRGAAKLKLGDAGGRNDIERAKKLDKGILDAMTKLGVSP
ncbi:MAG TPA: hypothetical protein VHT51_12350, partial [Micropepsaceae bacterium]|jgi:tetratricopeptide (TPR) repeat protein|nr:hypothetical protein [Micropepsaceae bacterium]